MPAGHWSFRESFIKGRTSGNLLCASFFRIAHSQQNAMNHTRETDSRSESCVALMPYLQSAGSKGFFLRFRFLNGAPEESERYLFATTPVGIKDIAVLRQADITIGYDQKIMPVLALMQSDDYGRHGLELSGLTNQDIDRHWQRALDKAVTATGELFPATLPEQRASDNTWLQFESLFYCLHRDLYCHPRCPQCGSVLGLCRDDELLEKAGLPAYGKSLERFMYCASCSETNPLFYARKKSGSDKMPVAGANELVAGFEKLLDRSDLAESLPCIGCPEAPTCYGSEKRVVERMHPVAFYPFYMVLQEAHDLSASDYLALLSGADLSACGRNLPAVRQLEDDGGTGLLFHTEDSRRFPEVLYLKLSFLQELIDLCLSRPDVLIEPADRLSLDGIWVGLGKGSGRLPLLWSFSLYCIDVIGSPALPLDGREKNSRNISNFLGRAWFHVLLTNSVQFFSQLAHALDALLDKQGNASPDFSGSEFSPGNLFWQPDERLSIEAPMLQFWQETLSFGIKLLRGCENLETLQKDVANLRNRIRCVLFQAPPAESHESRIEAGKSEDVEIGNLLKRIFEKWTRDDGEQGSLTASPPQEPDSDGDVEETIILLDQAEAGIEKAGAAGTGMSGKKDVGAKMPRPYDELEKPLSSLLPVKKRDKTMILRRRLYCRPAQTRPSTVRMRRVMQPNRNRRRMTIWKKPSSSAGR